MAKVLANNIMSQKAERTGTHQEASKVDEVVSVSSVQEKEQEFKNSEESCPAESNVIRASSEGLHSDGEAHHNNQDMMEVDQKGSEISSQRENEHKSDDTNLFQHEVNANFLRRSIRNAKNSMNSYAAGGRRPFKYDDFEYGHNIKHKAGLEMNPPGSVTSTKRKRKACAMTPVPFPEGIIRRSVSAKTPSSQAVLPSTESNGVIYNQGRWT